MTDRELLADYWAGQAQFGPLEVGPTEYLRGFRKDEALRIRKLKSSDTTPLERVDWAGVVRLMGAHSNAQVAETTQDDKVNAK